MKKIGSFISIVCIINFLMLAGFVGFLWGTGRLDKPKAQAIGDLLRQPGTPEGLRAKLYDIMTPATQTRPATTSAPATMLAVGNPDIPASAQERIDYVKKLLEEERLRLDAEAQKQREAQEALANQAKDLVRQKNDLDAREKAYRESLTAAATKEDADGFAKMMSIIGELKPKQVKDLLMSMPPAEVARYVAAMEPDQAAKILGEFKSPDEKTLINGVLSKLRGAQNSFGTGAALEPSTTTQPVAAASAGKAGS